MDGSPVAAHSAAAHRSLNGEIVHRLESTWAAGNAGVARLRRLIDHPQAVRVRSGHTRDDVESVLAICRDFDVDQLLLSARLDDLNTCCLALVIETPEIDFVLDGSCINLQRRPRMLDVKLLLEQLDRLGSGRALRVSFTGAVHLTQRSRASHA